ncbi:two-component system sensor histidine kinase MprB [Actinokineospora baliensis]|uniref:HAMP domain-containing sensor histidine kinase n=1 Tax=Actinokineospora baliensis TaxID=547056 RepID=UPI00195687A5|nr:HAMP domain-containing sensor histidine kinase [Actinokineospora baliensis]MBM7775941.1 two-component system sensor histidine kinase MprB [Actinokineospora baliensis]
MRLSLRSRLTVLAVGAVAVAVLGVALTSWLLVRGKLNRDFDDRLQSAAKVAVAARSPEAALGFLSTTPARDERRGPPRRDPYGVIVQFLDADGRVTGTAGGPAIPVTGRAMQAAAGVVPRAPEEVLVNDERYRVLTLPRADGAAQVALDAEDIERTLAELGAWHGLVGLIGVALAAVVGWLVARTALRPVDELTAAAEDVARTQDLSAGIAVRGTDEIARLGGALNAMLAALASSREAQRRLVQDAGHELRTPLTSLRNNVELLVHAAGNARDLPEEDRTRLLADLRSQAEELTTLIGELVELSTGDRSPEAEEVVDLADVVGPAVERARARAPRVRYTAQFEPAVVRARPVSLERAVLNLLDNAAKWSPDGATVTARVTAVDGWARVDVDDEGPGIAEQDRPHVFERFYRAEAARALPGSGLGLAIVAQVAAQHGGGTDVGTAPTGGARVSILLPLVS